MQNFKSYSGTQQTIKSNLPYEAKRENFNFLLQSIDRQKFSLHCDKENQQHNQGRLSIKIKPNKFEKETISHNLTKSTFIGLNKSIEKEKQEQKNNNDALLQNLIYKVKKYLALTEPLIQKDNKEDRAKKQAVNTACEIIEALTALQQTGTNKKKKQESVNSSLNSTGNLVLGSNKSMSSSFHFPNGLADSTNFLKKIENLQQQKLQLQNIISQHERANIKMFIQLNEGESEQIQSYKKQLSSLFQKYKQLQKLVRKQCEKSKGLQMIIDQYRVSSSHLSEKNQYLSKIAHFQTVINQQNHYLGKALQEIQYMKQQLTKYRVMEVQYNRIIDQLKKQKSKPLHKFSHNTRYENQKTTLNTQFSHESSKNSSQVNSECSPFSNITLKPSLGADENLLRMLFTQATMIDQILNK